MHPILLTFFFTVSCLVFRPTETAICNEAICASVVSKCMLTQSCKCDLTHCSCCKDCYNCLSYLYSECCSCVDMCPGSDVSSGSVHRQSYVEEFPDGIPELFAALTAEPDSLKRWKPVTVPIPTGDLSLQSIEQDNVKGENYAGNCTVAYMSQCMSWNKCKASCQSMGSSSFRWFHDGCCECIGDKCVNFGIDESRCLACGEGGKKLDEDAIEDDLDYGEDMDATADTYS